MADNYTTLLVEDRDDRLHVRLNRPEARNAINHVMARELDSICASLEDTPKILVLSGTQTPSGGVFASGADIAELRERRRNEALAGINSGVFTRIAKLPLPVIAALDGYALGGGAELAYAADFRIGTPRLKIGNPETGLGILAAAGASWRLRELVGEPVAKEILLAGRILGAEEALELHLITGIYPAEELLQAADALADRICRQDPLAVRITKSVFHSPAGAHPVIDQLAQGILFESEAKFDRMQKFLNKKNPDRNKTDE